MVKIVIKLRLLSLIVSTLFVCNVFSANIIFDLGGVLFKTNKMVCAKKAGLVSLSLYTLCHFKKPPLFELLNKVEPFTDTPIKPYDDQGNELPGIMCDWLKGISTEDILIRIKQDSPSIKSLWSLVKAVFDPKTMADCHKIIPAAQKMVENCIALGHKVYILSNWNRETFALMEQRYPEFFKQFTGTVLSCDCGLLKPDPEIYEYFLDKYNLKPETCFFIDNQQENVKSAKSSGIKSKLLMKQSGKLNFNKLNEKLDKWLNHKQKKELTNRQYHYDITLHRHI